MSEERDFPEESQDEAPPEPTKRDPNRSRDLLGRKDSKIRKKLAETWNQVKRGFEDQAQRADEQMDYWDAYNCRLNDKQYYEGDAQIYVPIIHDAINAIDTRIPNQLLPDGGHYVDAISDEESQPQAIMALVDKYIRDSKLKTRVCKPLIRHGYIEGQFNLYVDWSEIEREIVSRETHGERVQIAQEEIELPGEDIEDIDVEEIIEARPACEVLHDSDVLVWPATSDTVDEALAAGGGVAIVRRWSKLKIEAMIEAEHINREDGKTLLAQMDASKAASEKGLPPDAEKLLNDMVGIHKHGSEAVIWEVWKLLPLSDEGDYAEKGRNRICRAFLSADQSALGCARNPHWNDRVPLLSAPVEKIGGVFKGKSQCENVISLQYEANDAANEGADMAHMSACGLILRDTTTSKQPLILNPGAIWDVDPNKVKFAEFPDLTPRAITRIQYCIQQIFQSLSINPSMLPQQTSTSRRNQAQVAQEQQVDLLTTTEAGSVLVEDIFSPLIGWFVDLDYQYRDRPLTARLYGTMGVKANMEPIPPQQTRTRFDFRWVGLERARNAQTNQQKVAWLNVARGMEPQLAQQGKQLDFVPALEESARDLWGPHIQIIKDVRASLSMDPQQENQLLADGFDVPIHMLDNDEEHLPLHIRDGQQLGMPENFKAHIQRHLIQRGLKQKAAMAAQSQQQQQPGGQGQPPRGGAPPRMGAQPTGPQLVKGPPGAIHADQMPRAGAVPMPRRM